MHIVITIHTGENVCWRATATGVLALALALALVGARSKEAPEGREGAVAGTETDRCIHVCACVALLLHHTSFSCS